MNHFEKLGFHDRNEAGYKLAEKLRSYRKSAIVLALPRGGVPVGYEIAHSLHVPLDVLPVRKLGVPRHEELAMGAIALGGECIFNHDIIRELQIGEPDITWAIAREQEELERRNREYRDDLPFPEVKGKTVILVDDGLATGATMRAAIAAMWAKKAGRIIVAVPVGAEETCHIIEKEVDALVTLIRPRTLYGVGHWYHSFPQLADKEVHAWLDLAREYQKKLEKVGT